MKPRDILAEILAGTMSEEQAVAFQDEVIEYIHSSHKLSEEDSWPSKWMCLSQLEWTASNAPFTVLANWRKNGWPNQCFVCKQKLLPEIFGWLAREHDGEFGLRHVKCDEEYLEKVRQIAMARGYVTGLGYKR